MSQDFQITLPSGGEAVCRIPTLADWESHTESGSDDEDAARFAHRLIKTIDAKIPPDLGEMKPLDLSTLALVVNDYVASAEDVAGALASVEDIGGAFRCNLGTEAEPLVVEFAAPTVANLKRSRELARGNKIAERCILMRLVVRSIAGRPMDYGKSRSPEAWTLNLAQSQALVHVVYAQTVPTAEVLGKARRSVKLLVT